MEPIIALGRRKCSVARVRMTEGTGKVLVNGREVENYFPSPILQYKVNQAFTVTETTGKFDVKVNVDGGGITGQAEAIRLGIARAIITLDPELKSGLRQAGLVTRDPRMVERKKPGQKKARKKFQFSKR